MTPSELDQLADYAEGLLDGTPDAEVIAGRIATDQEWADAYRQLTASLPGITAALEELADPPLPDEVAARLDRALAAEPRPLAAASRETDDDGTARRWITADSPDDQDRIRAQRAAARARRRRAAKVGQWAAAAAAVAVIGVTVFRSVDRSGNDSATQSSAESGARPSVLSAPAGPRSVHVSGTSYSTAELGPQARTMLGGPTTDAAAPPEAASAEASPSNATPSDAAASSGAASSGAGPTPAQSRAAVPSGLTRLTNPTELTNCLAALGLGQPLAVDYATLEGSPAVVIVTEDASAGRLVVVAAGADCGVNGFGDERARTTVAR